MEAIARALGDTLDGLTGTEIGQLLCQAKWDDVSPSATKWVRLYDAFARRQDLSRSRDEILEFVRLAMQPVRHIHKPERYERLRERVNRALAFSGLEVAQNGDLIEVQAVTTLDEATARSAALKADLERRNIHPRILEFCRPELVAENYFHAVQEAVKSVRDRLRQMTNLDLDGESLANSALGGDMPLVKINNCTTRSERMEQAGFSMLFKGLFSMYRNTTAHEAKIAWPVSLEDAADVLSVVSLMHRRLDGAK